MSESYPDSTQSSPLNNIDPIELSQGQLLVSADELARYVEPPALPACLDLYDKNIKTISSSANRKDAEEAYIVIDFSSLSDSNKEIALRLGSLISPVRNGIEDNETNPEELMLAAPLEAADTADTIEAKLKELVAPFQRQKLLWAPTYSLNEIKKIYGYAEDEQVEIDDFVEDGLYYDTQTRMFHLSEELYKKSLEPSEADAATK